MKTFEHVQTSTNHFANTQTTHTIIRFYNNSLGFLNKVQTILIQILLPLEHVKYRARLKSDRSPVGSDRVRQKGLGFNL
jgi:hypothetical protein